MLRYLLNSDMFSVAELMKDKKNETPVFYVVQDGEHIVGTSFDKQPASIEGYTVSFYIDGESRRTAEVKDSMLHLYNYAYTCQDALRMHNVKASPLTRDFLIDSIITYIVEERRGTHAFLSVIELKRFLETVDEDDLCRITMCACTSALDSASVVICTIENFDDVQGDFRLSTEYNTVDIIDMIDIFEDFLQ